MSDALLVGAAVLLGFIVTWHAGYTMGLTAAERRQRRRRNVR